MDLETLDDITFREVITICAEHGTKALYDETYWVAEWQLRNGGSFSKALGGALAYADIHNIKKIKETWPEFWEEGLSHTEERRANQDYY